jgi:GntR family transcriptional repressor for pyruvate dehydrogenase complex
MSVRFHPIRPRKISEEIVEQIREMISRGQLGPGDRLPSERDLAGMLGVSRPSVREAIMVLDAMGLVEARQGGGTYIRSLAETALYDPLSIMVENDPRLLHALVEVRMGLESWSAFLAAQRADESDLALMEEIITEMGRRAARGGWDADLDSRFHYAITAAARNTLQLHVLNTIHTLFHASVRVTLAEFNQREGEIELLLHQHRTIFEAIARRDPEGARGAMLTHLALVEEKMASILRAATAAAN